SIQVFNQLYDGINVLLNLIETHDLDMRFCYFGQQSDFAMPLENDLKIPMPDKEIYNQKVENALEELVANQPSFASFDKGRNEDEKSCVWVEKGHFHAMGYIDDQSDLNSWDEIKGGLERYIGNHYMMQVINSFVKKN